MMRNEAVHLRGVVFDALGTLVRMEKGRHPYRTLQALMAQFGRRPQPDDALRMLTENATLSGFAAACGVRVPLDQLEQLEAEVAAEVRSVEVYDDAVPALIKIKSLGLKLAICSNLAKPYGAALHSVLPRVDAYALSYEVGAAKPNPFIYQYVCQELGCLPSELLFVGDTLAADVTGPRDFGMSAVHLVREGEAEVVPTIRSLHELETRAVTERAAREIESG